MEHSRTGSLRAWKDGFTLVTLTTRPPQELFAGNFTIGPVTAFANLHHGLSRQTQHGQGVGGELGVGSEKLVPIG